MKRALFTLIATLLIATIPVPTVYADDTRNAKQSKKEKKKEKRDKKALAKRLKGIDMLQGKAPKCKKTLLVYNFSYVNKEAEEALKKLAEQRSDLKKKGMEVLLICHDSEEEEKDIEKFIKAANIKQFPIVKAKSLNNNISAKEAEKLNVKIPKEGGAILDNTGVILKDGPDALEKWEDFVDDKKAPST